jgi:hypothetical protein
MHTIKLSEDHQANAYDLIVMIEDYDASKRDAVSALFVE